MSRIERGLARPSLGTLLYLAQRLGTPPSYLLGEQVGPDVGGASSDAEPRQALAEARTLLSLGAVGDASVRFEAAQRAAAVSVRAAALVGRGLALVAGDRLAEAREALQAGVRLAEEAGAPFAESLALGWLGLGYCAQREGAEDAALEYLQRAATLGDEAASDARAAALAAMAAIHRQRGDTETARSLYRQAARILSETAMSRRRARARLLAARRAAEAAGPPAMAPAAERAAELAALAEAAALAARVALALADLALAQGRSAEAAEWLQQALAASSPWGVAGDAPDAHAIAARATELLQRVKRQT